jgi:hypothetical protein
MSIRISTQLKRMMLGQQDTLVTNGTFDSATTGWTATNATLASVAGGQTDNCLQITNSTTLNGEARQDIATFPNIAYILSLYAKLGTAATVGYHVGTTSNKSSIASVTNLTPATFTQYKNLFEATDYTTRITMAVTTLISGNTGLFDTISVKPISTAVKDAIPEFFVAVYDSASAYPTQPASPDDAISDTQLLLFSDNATGNPLKWELDVNASNYLVSLSTTIPVSPTVNTGTCKYFRLYRKGDSPTSASTSLPRIDGTVGVIGDSPTPDMRLTDVTVVSGTKALSAVKFTIPLGCLTAE